MEWDEMTAAYHECHNKCGRLCNEKQLYCCGRCVATDGKWHLPSCDARNRAISDSTEGVETTRVTYRGKAMIQPDGTMIAVEDFVPEHDSTEGGGR